METFHKNFRVPVVSPTGDLWLMSTPYGKRGFFWEEWEHGGEEWERINVAATECSRISPQLLAEEGAKGDQMYRRLKPRFRTSNR